ncbi:hypothetical protein QJS04_geneDACA012213 [Acorus gramineus]|uniref:Uncharacterized protein n=1 Tax=Acorus gramineus TaxID=55184 RepID=A0AAV9BB30_ACOGR|nr:hypothetical protein QJS04_geneDACA012213 [Acorus gramineus]
MIKMPFHFPYITSTSRTYQNPCVNLPHTLNAAQIHALPLRVHSLEYLQSPIKSPAADASVNDATGNRIEMNVRASSALLARMSP